MCCFGSDATSSHTGKTSQSIAYQHWKISICKVTGDQMYQRNVVERKYEIAEKEIHKYLKNVLK